MTTIPKIIVPKTLQKPHELIALTKEVFNKNIIDDYGCFSRKRKHMLHIRVSPKSAYRALRIMNTIIKTAGKLGNRIIIEQPKHSYFSSTYFVTKGQKVEFSITEKTTRTQNPKYNKDDELNFLHHKFLFYPTGKLSLQIILPYSDFPTTFQDKDEQLIENQLSTFFCAVYKVAKMQNRKDQLEKLEEIRYVSSQKLKGKLKIEQEAEVAKIKTLENKLTQFNKAQQIKGYIKQVSKEAVANKNRIMSFKELNEWIRWCNNYADAIDPTKNDFYFKKQQNPDSIAPPLPHEE